MNLVIDNINSVTGWSAGGSATVYGVNQYQEFIAGELSASVIFSFSAIGDYVEKTLASPVDVSSYDSITISLWSRELGCDHYTKSDDFSYRIDLGSGKSYYLPIYTEFCDVTLDISDLTSIEKIKITSLTDTDDYIIASLAVVSKDEFPYDIFGAIKEQMEDYSALTYGSSYECGQIQKCYAGDNSITFTDDQKYLQRYTKIKITDGVNSEYHHIERQEGRTFYFTSYYDGKLLKNDFVNGKAYVCFPAEFGMYETQIVLPGISILGIAPEEFGKDSDVETELDTFKIDGTAREGRAGKWYRYKMTIDCEAYELELLAISSDVAKKIISQGKIWVNGKKCYIFQSGTPIVIDPTDVANIIPKIQYSVDIEIKEDVWSKTRLPKTITVTNTITPIQ